jgi:WXXGXW repeat (2 copies)
MTHIAGDRETMTKCTMLAAVLAISLMTGCVQNQAPDVSPYPPVPSLISEEIPKPPVAAEALMWQPGHWDWNGTGYVWAKGQYVPAAGHGSLWMPGWWSRTPNGWTWMPPHWLS